MTGVGTIVLGVVTALATPSPATNVTPASAANVTWHDVTLAAPASELRSLLGDPLRIVAFDDGRRRVARYWLPGSDALFFVIEENGYIEGFRAAAGAGSRVPLTNVPADPSGVRLGDALDASMEKHPGFRLDTASDGTASLHGRANVPNVAVVYEFEGGRVQSFQWGVLVSPGRPAVPELVEPAGDSISDAILDAQKNENDGVRWEYVYLAYHPCDGETRWALKQQSLVHERGRAYDRLHVACPTTKVERDFYFNITPYFGKL